MIIAKLFISGSPGSGKTTLLKSYEGDENILTLDMDAIGYWVDDSETIWCTDLDELQKVVSLFEKVQENNKAEDYIFIIAGYSYNIPNVVKLLRDQEFTDVWLDVTEETLNERLIERIKEEKDWWKVFKDRPESIQAMHHNIDPKKALSDIDDKDKSFKDILPYEGMIEMIDKFKIKEKQL